MKVLIVDDDPQVLSTVESSLSPAGITVDSCESAKEALELINKKKYDSLILDIMLPDSDGFDLFQKIKKQAAYKNVPTLFLSSKEDIASKVSALTLGADDYVVKPFNMIELRARVESKIRKNVARTEELEEFSAGPLTFEITSQRVWIRKEHKLIDLTAKEFKILLLLARRPNWIFSREQILNAVTGVGVHVTDRTIDTHICTIRKKLGDYAGSIDSVLGEGYRFVDVEHLPQSLKNAH
ncbi:MAG: response regulator transcription factor [Bacteriovoracia bacterium]